MRSPALIWQQHLDLNVNTEAFATERTPKPRRTAIKDGVQSEYTVRLVTHAVKHKKIKKLKFNPAQVMATWPLEMRNHAHAEKEVGADASQTTRRCRPGNLAASPFEIFPRTRAAVVTGE